MLLYVSILLHWASSKVFSYRQGQTMQRASPTAPHELLFNFLIILTLPLITPCHVYACAPVCVRACVTLCQPWTQRLSRSLINSRRASQGAPKMSEGGEARVCCALCSCVLPTPGSWSQHITPISPRWWGRAVGEHEERGCVYVYTCWRQPNKSAGAGSWKPSTFSQTMPG